MLIIKQMLIKTNFFVFFVIGTRISLDKISKKFDLSSRNKNALQSFIDFISGSREKREFSVLKDISFEVKKGENLGIIGKNGSGKSTLLRVLAGIYKADSGEINIDGKVIYLTGFGHGLRPKLTMRENILLSGSVMGLSQESIKERFAEVVDFADLKDYVDIKLFKFSSGMKTRLATSIGLHCIEHQDPDILLVDEVIGGGTDKDYQKKALKKMEGLLKGGASVILVSHNLGAIGKYCDKVIWIDKGKIFMIGKPKEVIEKYENSRSK